METKREIFQTPNARRTRIGPVVAIVLVATVIAIAWVVFPLMTNQDGLPNRFPAAKAAQPEADSLGVRLKSAEEKLDAWPKERAGLTDRIMQIDKTLTAGIRRARAETTALVEGIKRDMSRSMEAIHSRVTGIESTQRETHDVVARLQEELSAVRRDLDDIREKRALQADEMQQIEQAQLSTQNEVSGLQNQMMTNQRKMDALAYQVERQNVGFEVSTDQTMEVVPGIYLTINHIDVGRQQVDGWLQIARDGRFLWLHDAGAQHPIAFSSRSDERAYHLVFTRISNSSAAGYLLVPISANTDAVAN